MNVAKLHTNWLNVCRGLVWPIGSGNVHTFYFNLDGRMIHAIAFLMEKNAMRKTKIKVQDKSAEQNIGQRNCTHICILFNSFPTFFLLFSYHRTEHIIQYFQRASHLLCRHNEGRYPTNDIFSSGCQQKTFLHGTYNYIIRFRGTFVIGGE